MVLVLTNVRPSGLFLEHYGRFLVTIGTIPSHPLANHCFVRKSPHFQKGNTLVEQRKRQELIIN